MTFRPFHRSTLVLLVATAVAIGSFAYRFNTMGGPLAGFENDHFTQLVRAIAMLDGEQPIRDFSETELRAVWPAPTYSVSALAQRVFGRSLRSEALLTIGMLSIGAAGVFWLSTQFAGAMIPALITALLAIALRPALYNYPKIIVYVLGIGGMLAYARRPTTARLVALALITVIGGLYRHDHGVQLAIASGALILLTHGRAAWRSLVIFAATCVVALLPGIVFVQVHGGFIRYLRDCLVLSGQEASRTVEGGLNFDIDRTQKLIVRAPLPEPPKPRIAVRWTPTLTATDRQRAEAQLHLLDPVPRTDSSNWSYVVDDPTADRLRAIVRDARAVDTDGIDRSTFELTATPPPQPPRWRQEIARWRIAPGVFRADNAAPWLYLVAWAVVIAATACAIWPPLTRATASADVPPTLLRATCVLALLMLVVLLRNPNPLRLADVSVPVAILGAWLLASIPRALRTASASVRRVVIAGLVIVLCVSTAAVAAVGDLGPQLTGAGFGDLPRARRQSSDVWQTLGGLPASLEGIDATLADAARYVRRCTRPTDRLFIGDFLPDVFYFSERPFASGQFAYFSNFYSSAARQRESIERWRAQSAPIALMPRGERFDNEFASDYPLLTEYLRTRYRQAGTLLVERGTMMDVWVDKSIASEIDSGTGLPCAMRR
jgi:hypothetical protein